jgi:predicted GIY-YIG superfamily endonuclease
LRAEAMKREKRIKKLSHQQKLRLARVRVKSARRSRRRQSD